jgi:VanZ family protein
MGIRNERIWEGIIAFVWGVSVCVVCYYSLKPELELPIEFWSADKIYHLLAYAWLAALPIVGFRNRKTAIIASVSMVILGALLEIGQAFVPGRTFSLLDMTVNGVGVVAGMICGRSAKLHLKKIIPPAAAD